MSILDTSLIANVDLILAGMFQDQNKSVTNLNAKQQAFAKLLYEDIRQAYDSYMPNIHILDADKAANLLVDGILKDPEVILSISDAEYVPLVIAALQKASPTLRKKIREGIRDLHEKFSARVTGQNPIRLLNAKLSIYVRNMLRNSNGILDQESYIKLGNYFNKTINEVFTSNVALLGVSSESVGVVSKPHRYVFFQKSFLSGKDTINQNITSILKESLENVKGAMEYGSTLPVKSVTGKFMDFGHAGTRIGTSKDININTPALVKIIFNVVNLSLEEIKATRKDPLQARAIFINKTGHLKQSIEITKKFNYSTGMLIRIGMTTTSGMESEFNRQELGPRESMQLDKATKDRLNSSELMRYALQQRLSSTFLGPNIQKLVNGKSSYSFKEYITLSLIGALSKKTPPPFSQKVTKTKEKSFTQKILSTIGTEVKIKAKSQPKRQSTKSSYTAKDIPSTVSLTSLQNLINQQLQDVVSANMGDGNSRNVLNYRTGRLASSAKVEYMSESRAGMITAFYSYMKNPYATFSDGGKQSSPKSRDPKLLISKSIREIAATQVGNRLRAVNI
jgi:hypothetical protein